MSKVKKGTRLTGERNKKGNIGARRSKPATAKKKAVIASTKTAKRSVSNAGASARRKGRGDRAATKTAAKAETARKAALGRRKGAKRAKATKGTQKRLIVSQGRRGAVGIPVVRVAIKSLDPLRKCGPNTTVQLLYRVDESVDGRKTAHLVFFDRHGWYCEHGRTCPAVGYAKKYNGQIARVS